MNNNNSLAFTSTSGLLPYSMNKQESHYYAIKWEIVKFYVYVLCSLFPRNDIKTSEFSNVTMTLFSFSEKLPNAVVGLIPIIS